MPNLDNIAVKCITHGEAILTGTVVPTIYVLSKERYQQFSNATT